MNPLPPLSPHASQVKTGSLRRQLTPELKEIRDLIEKAQLSDEMTRQIDSWLQNFAQALKSSADEETVYNIYLPFMQELLRDPVTKAPLDHNALMGSDGYTYGQKSLDIYVWSVPDPYKTRSPMNSEKPERFFTVPHPVARHMVGWLQRHNALFYSEELEKTYLQLCPQQPPLSVQDRIQSILARQLESDQLESEQRKAQIKTFNLEREARFQVWEEDQKQPLKIWDDGNHLAEEALQKKLNQMAVQERGDFQRLHNELERAGAPFAEVQGQVDAFQRQEETSMAALKAQIEQRLQSGLKPLAGRIEHFTKLAALKIEEIAAKDRESLSKIDQSIKSLQAEIADLTKKNQDLTGQQQEVAAQIVKTRQEHLALQQGIYNTQKAIQEMKENSSKKMLLTIVKIGACCVASFALAAILQSTSIGAAIVPMRDGLLIPTKFPL